MKQVGKERKEEVPKTGSNNSRANVARGNSCSRKKTANRKEVKARWKHILPKQELAPTIGLTKGKKMKGKEKRNRDQ